MEFEKIRNLKGFPRGEFKITYEDRATLILERKPIKVNQKTGRVTYEFEGTVEFTYPTNNPLHYRSRFRNRQFKKLLQSTLTEFEIRNKQMMKREQL